MNPLRALLAALTPDLDEQADRMRAAAASLKTLRDDARSIRRQVGALAVRVDAVSRQLEQMRRLREGERDAGRRLDDLARVMDANRVAEHVRAAVARAEYLDAPVPRLTMDALWPQDVYDTMLTAIPDPVFFEDSPSADQTLRVPPRLAPVPAVVAWTFIAEIVETVLVPEVAARFHPASGSVHVEPGRLVRRAAGAGAAPVSAKAWEWGLIEIDMSGANSAVAVLTPYGGDASSAPAVGALCTYEVRFGSDGRSLPA